MTGRLNMDLLRFLAEGDQGAWKTFESLDIGKQIAALVRETHRKAKQRNSLLELDAFRDDCALAIVLMARRVLANQIAVDNLEAYTYTVAMRCMTNALRDALAAERLPREFSKRDANGRVVSALEYHLQSAPSIEPGYGRVEDRDLIEQLMKKVRLTKRAQEVFWRRWRREEFPEIAVHMGMIESTVKTIFYRTLKKLQQAADDE